MDATGIPALTLEQYDAQVAVCTGLFLDKMHDYGTAWRILRPSSLTDQISSRPSVSGPCKREENGRWMKASSPNSWASSIIA